MHEFELGVFKAVFIHLVRMCHCEGPGTVQELDERYKQLAPCSDCLYSPKFEGFGWFLRMAVQFDDSQIMFRR